MICEGLDSFTFVPTAVEKSFLVSSAPGWTKDVKKMITFGFRPTQLDEIQILGDLVGKIPRMSIVEKPKPRKASRCGQDHQEGHSSEQQSDWQSWQQHSGDV